MIFKYFEINKIYNKCLQNIISQYFLHKDKEFNDFLNKSNWYKSIIKFKIRY